MTASPPAPAGPAYGLVCLTAGPEIRFRTVTRTRYLALEGAARRDKLLDIYSSNIAKLREAADFCAARGIRLYRLSSSLFPMLDLRHDGTEDQISGEVFAHLAPQLREAGAAFTAAGIRTLMHPEQFIVLNSERPEVRESSLHALGVHARVMDALGLERSHWNILLLHGGKGGRGAELAALIPDLPDNIRLRLALENDERAFGAADLLPVCEATGTPFVFDAHHQVVHERLPGYEHPSLREWVLRARGTWQPPEWQMVHLSNGIDGPHDRRHSWLITELPSSYADVPWIEVEAKGKEEAVAALMGREKRTN
ncbi:UV-endonuclease UvdE [Deinococcus proteolyticus MRP]|uniref:UV-endonuclease UvdE n=1 Tax=Deinococcus proteolyticus (strain ATCC 35074 / DSM 20540 / JCM 6276 / NBRC 101906 / NCIMB 13154 / VKM Ac-1939 / CCM 2703 / MRP) TaxID=693977 RepID=F0RJC2_DEIPM|nr:UV DNA damage repair endonuclease UvsE [Deinococcus proteolyticus]ADY25463.1 UV-endonuclease UvdE [Deinococcus proteolyticus MRP]